MNNEKKMIMIVVTLSQFIQQIIANITVIALPNIINDLNFAADTILWVNLIYLTVFVALCIPCGKLIDRYGVKRCLKQSIVILFISVILSVIAQDQYLFLLSRLLQGLSSAILSCCIYMIVVKSMDEDEIGVALGIVSSAGYIGMLIAPSLMGMIMHIANWKLGFLIMVPIIAIILLVLSRVKTEWRGEKVAINKTSTFLFIIFMILNSYSITTLDEYGIIPLIISFIFLFIFIKVEKNTENPLYKLYLLKDKRYVIGNYAAMATYFTTTISITALSLYLQIVLDFDEFLAGVILIVAPTLMIGISGSSGKLSNRYDPRILSSIALMFITAAMIIFLFIEALSFELILLGCVLQGIGNGLFSAPNNKYVLTLVDKKDLADASSMLSTSKEFGKILSSGIYTLILSVVFGNNIIGKEEYDYLLTFSTERMMIINIIIASLGAVLLLLSKYKYEKWINP